METPGFLQLRPMDPWQLADHQDQVCQAHLGPECSQLWARLDQAWLHQVVQQQQRQLHQEEGHQNQAGSLRLAAPDQECRDQDLGQVWLHLLALEWPHLLALGWPRPLALE